MPNEGYLTEKDLEEIEQRLREVFMTKEEFTQYRSDHEERIATLEKTMST